METILNFLKTEIFLIIIAVLNILLILAFIINSFKVSKIRKEYKDFIKKLSKGNNIEEMLKGYISKVEENALKNKAIEEKNKQLNIELQKCIKKVGMVRYTAFKDTGSDLSFALCLLDNKDNGVVLNGIYSREMSNIYAKPIENGKSTHTLSDEEQEAIDKAIQNS